MKMPGQKFQAGKLSARKTPPSAPTKALPQNVLENLSQLTIEINTI
jgi:hypothetical protein